MTCCGHSFEDHSLAACNQCKCVVLVVDQTQSSLITDGELRELKNYVPPITLGSPLDGRDYLKALASSRFAITAGGVYSCLANWDAVVTEEQKRDRESMLLACKLVVERHGDK